MRVCAGVPIPRWMAYSLCLALTALTVVAKVPPSTPLEGQSLPISSPHAHGNSSLKGDIDEDYDLADIDWSDVLQSDDAGASSMMDSPEGGGGKKNKNKGKKKGNKNKKKKKGKKKKNNPEDELVTEKQNKKEEVKVTPLPTQTQPTVPVQTYVATPMAIEVLPDKGVSRRSLSDEERLLNELFGDYNPSARPVMNSSKTVKVGIQFSLMHLKDLDVRSQVLTTTGLLILDWTDERLTWNPAEHNNLTEVIIESKSLWRPEFAVINGAEKIYEDYNQFRTVITNEGLVHWEPGGVFKTMCEIDITYYPFDEQTCELMFGAWSYHTSKMNLTNSSETINLDSYKLNGEWQIYGTEVIRNEFFYECCPNERFANVGFLVYLRRRHTFYVLNVILPSIMTSVLLLSVFFCTPGQKVQIGVVVLLSFRIFLINVSGNIPKTSDHIPLLGIYLTCTMAITTLSMVLTVFVLNLHHVVDRPVPGWAKRLVFLYIARMLGMCSMSSAYTKDRRARKRTQNSAIYQPGHDGDGEERTAIIELHNRTVNGAPETKNNPGSDPYTTYPMLNKPREELNEEYAKDWKKMAEVFDRLFFWLFLLAILISTLVLFHPLTNSYMKKVR